MKEFNECILNETVSEMETKEVDKKTIKDHFESICDWCRWNGEKVVGGVVAVGWAAYLIWLIKYLKKADQLVDLEVKLKEKALRG